MEMSFWFQKGVCSNKRHSYRQTSTKWHPWTQAFLCLGVAVTFVPVQAQEQPPGISSRLDFTQRLQYSDNPDLRRSGEGDDSEFFARTLLSYGLESVNSIERFTFGAGLTLDIGREDEDTVDTRDPNVSLGYRREVPNSFFDVGFRFRQSDAATSFFDSDFDQDGRVINQDGGTRDSFLFTLSGAVGREAPIGAGFDYSFSKLQFNGTDDPSLSDSTDQRFAAQIDFRPEQRITANLNMIYRDFDPEDNGTNVNRETLGFGVGLQLEVTPLTTADAFVRYDEIERSGGETGTDDGLTVGANVVRALPNGTLDVAFLSEVSTNENGRRSSAIVTRDMALPRGALSLGLGVTGAGSVVGTDPLIEANYRYDLPTAVLSFGASRTVRTTDDNQEEINSRVSFGYNQRINSVSNFGVDISFLDRNELRNNPNDGQRVDIGLSYRHSLTRDWGFVAGYNYALVTEDANSDRESNTVFIGLQRTFDWFR